MKSLLYIFVLICLVSCSKSNKAVSSKDKPEEAAVYYAKCIMEEKYDEYIQSMSSCDSASEEYKSKMKVLVKQMVRTNKAEKDSCVSIECTRAEIKYDGNYANTFLTLRFSDNSAETILLPLIWDKDRWRLR